MEAVEAVDAGNSTGLRRQAREATRILSTAMRQVLHAYVEGAGEKDLKKIISLATCPNCKGKETGQKLDSPAPPRGGKGEVRKGDPQEKAMIVALTTVGTFLDANATRKKFFCFLRLINWRLFFTSLRLFFPHFTVVIPYPCKRATCFENSVCHYLQN